MGGEGFLSSFCLPVNASDPLEQDSKSCHDGRQKGEHEICCDHPWMFPAHVLQLSLQVAVKLETDGWMFWLLRFGWLAS